MSGKQLNKGGGVSEKQNYGTPWTFYNFCNEQVEKATGSGFDKDVCAEWNNCKHPDYFTEEDNSLMQSWKGIKNAWCNPEFAKSKHFVPKAFDEWKENQVTTVLLIPVSSCTYHFRDCVARGQVWFIFGRIGFYEPDTEVAKGQNPQSMALVVFSDYKFEMGDMSGQLNYLSWPEIDRIYPDEPPFMRTQGGEYTERKLEKQMIIDL